MPPRSLPSHRVTQKEIAKVLNLAQSTIATALNPESAHKLQPETVSRIQEYVKKIGYRPRKVAQIMQSGRSHTIGAVFLSGVYHAPQERVKLLASHTIGAGFNLIAVDMGWFGSNIEAAQAYLIDTAVEGVILCNLAEPLAQQWKEFCEQQGMPMLTMAGGIKGNTVNRVESDLRTALREMTAHHIAMGSKRLSLLLHTLPFGQNRMLGERDSAKVRAQGFLDAIEEAGGIVETDATISRLFGDSWASKKARTEITGNILYSLSNEFIPNGFEYGRRHMHRLIESGAVPDSLICSNDDIAVGALSYCYESEILVPQELLISGVDDAPFSRYCGVPLTTIRQPSEEMAKWAVKRIVELIEEPQAREVSQDQLFPCELVLRSSTLGLDSERIK